ncbi:MAG: ATP-binding protein [Defluviitaleaceae bacterium]|nr:ATP-binding protein [Defluviitaleaceae bacterium]
MGILTGHYNWSILVTVVLIIVSVSNLFIIFLTVIYDTKTRMRRDYIRAYLLLVSFSLFYSLMTIAENEELARMYWALGFVSNIVFYPSWLVCLTNVLKLKNNNFRNLLNALSVFTLVFALVCVFYGDVRIVNTAFGNQFSYSGPLFLFMFFYVSALIAGIFIAFVFWMKQAELKGRKRDIFVLIMLVAATAPVGYLTDFALPVLTGYTAVPLAGILILPPSVQFYLSAKKYRTFGVTASNISEYIFTSVTIPTFVLNRRNRVSLQNKAAVSFLGRSIVGKDFSGVISTEIAFDHSFTDKIVTLETRHGTKTCDMVLTIETDKYDDAICKIVVLRDITDIVEANNHMGVLVKEATRELEYETAMLNAVFDAMPDILFCKDLNFRHLRINKSFEEMFNINREDILGKTEEEALNLPKEVSDSWRAWDTRVLNEKTMLRNEDHVPLPDGTIRIYESLKVPLIIDDTPIGLLGLARDVTSRKKLETELMEASKLKSSFLAKMSHEIRTPMNTIIGMTDIILQRENIPADIEDDINRIATSGDMLLGIINDILDFSKIEADKMDIIAAPYNIENLIDDVIQVNRIYDHPIVFELEIDENVPILLVGDELRVKQVLNNLLSNAFKYTDEGVVTLKINFEPLDENNITLILTVSDTGRGMTKEQLSTLFVEYQRFDEGYDRNIVGTGLGAPIVIRLLNLMGGEIISESEPGAGSTFTVRLPQEICGKDILGKEAADNLQQFNTSHTKYSKRGAIIRTPIPNGRVLVVDDVSSNLHVAEGLMKPYALNIETAGSGFEAIEKIKSGAEYDIIFMDHMMPKMDGMETTKNLRDLGCTFPIVALTANAIVGQREIFLQNGFDDSTTKPIDIRHLDYILNKYVRVKYPTQATAPPPAEESRPPSRLEGKHIDGVDIEAGLKRYDGDEDIYLKILRSYVPSLRTMLNEAASFSTERLHDYKIAVHGIRGASFDVFAEQTSEAARLLEAAANQEDTAYITEHNPTFLKNCNELADKLDALLSQIKEEKPQKDKIDPELLSTLADACEIYDMDTADTTMAEIEKYQYVTDATLFEWLRENIDKVNYTVITEGIKKESLK